MGYAVMGTASASGAKRTIEAAQKAIASPLLEAGAIDGARGILINITGSASLKLAEVQQACSIIQSAAHEDANIIFGAVLDEKMKDAVKITVIATGFREAPCARPRQQETRTSFAAAHEEAMEFPEEQGSHEPMHDPEAMPRHIMESGVSGHSMAGDRGYGDDVAPVPVAQPADRLAGEVISLDSMRGAIVTNFEQDDLDVPAFLRKRNDVM
jgi:cell division protein FtsZ